MTLYFADRLYRYDIGVRLLEDALMDQVDYNDQQVDVLVHAIEHALTTYPARHPQYWSMNHLRRKLDSLVLPSHGSMEKRLSVLASILDSYVQDVADKKSIRDQIGEIAPLRCPRDRFVYHRSRILNTYLQYFTKLAFGSSRCTPPPLQLVQYYDPFAENYLIQVCHEKERKYIGVSINGNVTKDGTFHYKPTKTGIHRFEIIVRSADFDRFCMNYDTIEYAIKVVDKGGVGSAPN